CRNDADEARLQNLKELAIELKVEDDVEFYKNVTYRNRAAGREELCDYKFTTIIQLICQQKAIK
nr:GDP-Man:Man(3)GlcNAc(2)-PP-Dol alpha-1,2-mannosyltransferase [Tanacetum cinerariifolium]